MEGGVHSVDNVHREGLDPDRRRVFLLVGRDLSAQTKVNLAHPFVPGVVATHGAKDMADGA